MRRAAVHGIPRYGRAGPAPGVGAGRGCRTPLPSSEPRAQAKPCVTLVHCAAVQVYWATPNVLIYVTGGLSYGDVNTKSTVAESINSVNTSERFGTSGGAAATRSGWVAGAGVEWTFWSNVSSKIEYRYYDLGSVRYDLPTFNQFGSGISTS
jgi:opacity protein-like surface antigen